jgi:hypothetical protein
MRDIIAVVFDFDDTLAPDSTSSFLNGIGVDVHEFWTRKVQCLIDEGWDPVLAYMYMMVIESNTRPVGGRITRDLLAKWGPKIEFYRGVTRIFKQIQQQATAVNPDIAVEFYVISSGVSDMLKTTKIARYFTDMWSSDFEYNLAGEILFPKRVVSFTDKTRYLYQISKGIYGPESRKRPFDVNKKVPPDKLRVRFENMVFVGDGFTDIPCFSLMKKQGGVAIGVYNSGDRRKWGRAWGFVEDGRVSNLVPADYAKGSALVNSLLMAIEAIASRVNLRRSTYQG